MSKQERRNIRADGFLVQDALAEIDRLDAMIAAFKSHFDATPPDDGVDTKEAEDAN